MLKAAQHTQGSYAAICRNVLLDLFPLTRDDRMLHAASLLHASGTFVLPFWMRGACSVVLPGFVPNAYLAAVQEHRATAINLVPTMLQMLLDYPELDECDRSSLRRIREIGARLRAGGWGREEGEGS
ncbi:Long-chain-fatty-acid--CoA ligase [Cystobacter fuscus DSM 2262]|uniref:Long-chain-fatty-acid--CoA ligase n=1 Tax=Cystobacter fuscus (strain ATCC 25194 / DSM 2262 / NBRC 100088 / M29) TaxID=1242864 RepID=S9QQQ9_CYSF2|nr:AMP-binding protein [Cystobacter fuscus]EPX63599.1 Long-chain-fatty-acid--CoA ligase [Cystobacter fuscus DSM 2262]